MTARRVGCHTGLPQVHDHFCLHLASTLVYMFIFGQTLKRLTSLSRRLDPEKRLPCAAIKF